ncbi:toxin C-terminal domain-containing protein [Avibacterium paragallinarum]|uniref:toxin C-terminal domain-containing protein n=1 Tax=Avibacterium paragallinarum TaxID=728 RepID=UPI00397CA981
MASGLTAQQNGSATNTVSTLNAMALGGEIGKRAVENNYVALVARGCTAIPSCRNKVAKEIIEYSVKAGITGVIANEIVENISQDDFEHFITLSMMGNDEVTQKYLNYLTVKYSHSEIKLPSHTGGHQLENKPIQTHTGGNQIIDNGLPNNTGGIPIDVNIPSHIEGSPILEEDKTGHILSGSEVQVGDLDLSILEARNKDTIEAANKLGYKNRIPPQKAPFNSHGQPVYWNGKNYITPDIDEHNTSNGWKMFDKKGRRQGTYDKDLNRIKD